MAALKLSIADPCHENWNNMLPQDKGRYCLSCQKTVVDFTTMSDRQVFEYFRNYEGSTCGQFTAEQLDREITRPKTHSIGRWKYFWQILLPAVFSLHKTVAQPALYKGKVATTNVCEPQPTRLVTVRMGTKASSRPVEKPAYEIQGKVINDKREAIPFATISCAEGKFIVADSLGFFTTILFGDDTLTISSIGYEKKNFPMDSIRPADVLKMDVAGNKVVIEMNIELKQQEVKVPDVVVTGYGTSEQVITTGLISSSFTRRNFFTKKNGKAINTPAQLTIFPNPIQPGQSFQITVQVNKTSNYLLKIVDAEGRIVLERTWYMVTGMQTETIPGTALQQTGVYLVNLSNPEDKHKGLNGRILVQ